MKDGGKNIGRVREWESEEGIKENRKKGRKDGGRERRIKEGKEEEGKENWKEQV